MRILVDVDGIVADLLTKWLRCYNAEWDDTLTPGAIKTWDTHEHVKPECGPRIYSLLMRPGFFRDLKVIPGALAGVARIREMGHEVCFCTAAPSPDAAACKLEWLYEHFGATPQEIILTHKKAWIAAHLLIDDKPKTLLQWKVAQDGFTVAIQYPYNAHLTGEIDFLASSYRDPASAWEQIVSFVEFCES